MDRAPTRQDATGAAHEVRVRRGYADEADEAGAGAFPPSVEKQLRHARRRRVFPRWGSTPEVEQPAAQASVAVFV